jgi:nucleoside-diphosphate-sugar epimerase
MPTSLITGGAGFLGSNLTEALLKRGHRVLVLDNFLIGTRDNLSDFPQDNIAIIEHDIRQPILINEPIDFIWNLACIASPIHYVKYPIETIETNTIGIPNILTLARDKGAKVLHTSSSEVYGDALEQPQRESYWGNVNTLGRHACYKEGKRIAETILWTYAQQYPELDVRMVRIFNTYGPKMILRDGRMLTEFLVSALTNQALKIDGGGEQTRSTCYVSDLIAGLLAMMDNADVTRNEVVNLGSPDEHTVKEFAETVVRLTESSTVIESSPARSDDVKRRRPNIDKARSLLGWEPTISLEEGLIKTMTWVKAELIRQGKS